MPWYKKSLTMQEIIEGKNEEIRKDFSYIFRTMNFRPRNMFLISITKKEGVELYISPSSVFHVMRIMEKHSFTPDSHPNGGKITLIVGDEKEFKEMFP